MFKKVDTKKIILKTKQYEFADGLRDIQLGIVLIMMGGVWFWLMYQPSWMMFMIQVGRDYGRWAVLVAFLLVYCIPIVAALGMQRVMENIRGRWLWRESGMVKSSRILVPRHINILAVVIFISALLLGLRFQSLLETGDFYLMSLIMVAIGWSFGFTLVGLGVNLKLRRYVIMGVVGGVASTALFLYQSSLTGAGLLSFLGWGLILLISGLVVLKRVWPEIREGSHAG
jgi:hypothetical protein